MPKFKNSNTTFWVIFKQWVPAGLGAPTLAGSQNSNFYLEQCFDPKWGYKYRFPLLLWSTHPNAIHISRLPNWLWHWTRHHKEPLDPGWLDTWRHLWSNYRNPMSHQRDRIENHLFPVQIGLTLKFQWFPNFEHFQSQKPEEGGWIWTWWWRWIWTFDSLPSQICFTASRCR